MLCTNQLLILAPTFNPGHATSLTRGSQLILQLCYSIITSTYGFLLPIKCIYYKFFVWKAWCHVLVLPFILVNVVWKFSPMPCTFYCVVWISKLHKEAFVYWPGLRSRWLILARFFLVLLWTKAKNEVNIQPFWPNKLGQWFILWLKQNLFVQTKQ